jgi:SAM-dependent methyltransferase
MGSVERNYDYHYTDEFYKLNREYSKKSPQVIVPLVLELLPCQRVIDVGCGEGTWLKVFQEFGVEEILGVDGDYLDRNSLVISKEQFFPFDLTKPLHLDRQFDLAVSLEVAEHLPAESADIFINSLTSLAPAILFSAAIPHQPGEHHINTQWPNYWVNLFQARNYVVIDCIRKKIWHNPDVAYWYAQNILLFVQRDYLENNLLLKQEREENEPNALSIVHPELYINTVKKLCDTADPEKMSLKDTFNKLMKIIIRILKIKRNLLITKV